MKTELLAIILTATTFSAPINIKVDWNTINYPIDSMAFGVCGFQATNPINTQDENYRKNLKLILGTRNGGGLFRIHTWEMIDTNGKSNSWISGGKWNEEKIKLSIKGLKDAGIKNICINIPDGISPATKIGNPSGFADFCAQLVRIINVDGKLGVKYWECPNEADQANPKLTGSDEATVFNAAAIAMKKVDPTIKTGGPAVARPDLQADIKTFIDQTLPNLDFISFHTYGGDGHKTDEQVWASAGAEWYSQYITDYLNTKSPARFIPTFYDEFNVSWTWQAGAEQMNGMSGAIYDALHYCPKCFS